MLSEWTGWGQNYKSFSILHLFLLFVLLSVFTLLSLIYTCVIFLLLSFSFSVPFAFRDKAEYQL